MFQNNDKYTQAILLGESGTLYEVSTDYNGEFKIKVEGKSTLPAFTITEPYEVIYTRTEWEDDNKSYTNRDSYSSYYFSWNSKYATLLGNKIPTEFEKVETDLWGYIDTQRIENPKSNRFSHADGINSWAQKDIKAAATD